MNIREESTKSVKNFNCNKSFLLFLSMIQMLLISKVILYDILSVLTMIEEINHI